MNRSATRLCAALLATAWTAVASAQTTKPAAATAAAAVAPVTWSATVEHFARAAEKGDAAAVAALAPTATLRAFDSPERTDSPALAGAAAEWTLLGAHAYEFPPPSLAGDIAADVNASELVAAKDKQKMAPIDDAELARANTIAADWVAQTLGAERNHLIGVAVFWNVKLGRPMFVLLKGQAAGERFEVKLAVYGDPMVRRVSAAADR